MTVASHGCDLGQRFGVRFPRPGEEITDPRAIWMAYGTARQPLDGEAIKSALGSDPTAWQLRTE